MNVYPVNLLQGARFSQSNVLSFSDAGNIVHRYMKYRAWFPEEADPFIEMSFDPGVRADTLIVADTNCKDLRVTLSYSPGADLIVTDSDPDVNLINMYEIDRTRVLTGLTVRLTRREGTRPYLGYVFVGDKWELPRFAAGPEWETQVRGTGERTGDGQAFGNVLPTLDRFAAGFARVTREEKARMDRYLQAVQTAIPHVVDPYPEAHDAFPPRYATLTRGVSAQKRAESGFFWNFDLEWLEAR